jgi:hypothetical protein
LNDWGKQDKRPCEMGYIAGPHHTAPRGDARHHRIASRASQLDDLAPDRVRAYRYGMCRSIKTLRRPGEAATTGELEAAARQFVRKLSGYREPSAANREAFDSAIAEVAAAGRRLVESIGVDVEEGPDRWTPGSGRPRYRPPVLA